MSGVNIVIPIWNFGKAGGIRVLSKLANAFHMAGNNVLIITYYKATKPYFPVDCTIQYVDEKGDAVNPIEPVEIKNIVRNKYEDFLKYKSLKNALNRLSNDYDIALANANKTAFSVAHSKIKERFYYVQAYEVWYKGKLGWLYNLIARRSYKLNLIKIVNADLYKNYKEIHTDYVVPPGLDLSLYYPKGVSAYWNKKRPLIIGHIGREEEWKGSRETAEAIGILQKEGVRLEYRVAFNAPKDGLCSYELVKPDGDNNLSEYYRSIDVLVAPGRIQLGSIHYPVIEAMACGTPVITTGYYPATSENAYIVGVNSPNDIANAIKDIMSDYSLALKKVEISKELIKEFDWKYVSKKMLDIINENL